MFFVAYVTEMALSKNLMPMQQKPFKQWSKEDTIWINPGGNENYIIYLFIDTSISTPLLFKSQ